MHVARSAKPAFVPALTAKATAGAYSYTIPAGASKVDVILLGGGGGGGCGYLGGGSYGGQAGFWSTVTLVVGVDIAAGATITGTVGAAGTGAVSPGTRTPGGTGGTTTATASGWAGLSAAGGAGGSSWDYTTGYQGGIKSPGNKTFGGNPSAYVGGGTASGGAAGLAPGGGGGDGVVNQNPGTAGAAGEAWFYAY